MRDAIIISDIHLGSDVCQAKALWEFLEGIEDRSKKLILNGDVFDSIDMRRLNKHHWHVLSNLRRISDQMEVIWICGNHDGPADIISHLLGITVVDDYEFTTGDKKVLVFHGDKYDKFIDEHPFLTYLADTVYWFLQKIDKTHYTARMAKHNSKHYLHNSKKIMDGAIKFAVERACQIVCCGHTHHALEMPGDISYYNSGCWTEWPCSYLSVKDGKVELCFINDENPD
jgi:UDP-2,3-diacylglucosamine pyrophosphatase LpxH